MCCVLLHNMSIAWADELPEGAEDPQDADAPQDHINMYYDAGFFNNLGRAERRWLRQDAREYVRGLMDPIPTAR